MMNCQADDTETGDRSSASPLQLSGSADANWRPNGGENGDRYYRYFHEACPEIAEQIIAEFHCGLHAMIVYQDMTAEELGNLVFNACAAGFLSGQRHPRSIEEESSGNDTASLSNEDAVMCFFCGRPGIASVLKICGDCYDVRIVNAAASQRQTEEGEAR